MRIIKTIGLLSLICFTFFYTEKIMDVATLQDEIMIQLNEIKNDYYVEPINAKIDGDYIIPGKIGKEMDVNGSYSLMKTNGYFNKELIKYKDIHPETSIYNNYDKYIINGNIFNNKIALIFIINNKNVLNNVLSIVKNKNANISLFIDSNFLNSNIESLDLINEYEVYNYGNNGVYSMDNLIIFNNIIKNKTKLEKKFCLFLKEDSKSLNNCANSKIFSIMPSINGNYKSIKKNLSSGNIILINNTYELSSIIDFIESKGYIISKLSQVVTE